MPSFNILVKKTKTRYIFYIKEISLIHSSTSLSKGYKEIKDRSEEILKNLKDNNLDFTKKNIETDQNIFEKTKIFLLKSIIVTLCVSFVLIFAIIKSFEGVHTSIDKLKIKTGKEFWGPLQENILSLASEKNEIDEESEKKILNSIRIVVDRYKPYFDEFKRINSDSSD